jgi:superfamily II DNA or RNA helicase
MFTDTAISDSFQADAIELDFAEPLTLDFAEEPRAPVSRIPRALFAPKPGQFKLRDYQAACLEAIDAAWAEGMTRILAVLATGCGKTVIFSHVAQKEVAAEVGNGGRVLIIAHTDELLDQAADKLYRATGIEAEKEKAEHKASIFANVVVGSVQTLCREARLTQWPQDHFSLIVVDESHRSLAKSYQKVLRYFHFGTCSLADDWKFPEPTEPQPQHFARILGVTATADRGDKRSLGEFYQKCVFDYGLLQAVRDGYLVRPVAEQLPLKIDLRGIKTSRTANGSDYDISEVTARITPFLREIAQSIASHARDRKTVCFLPGVETARLLSAALRDEGLDANFVSGACSDRTQKLEWFDGAGKGSAMCNAMLLTEGWDCPDVSCVCVLRPTKIRSLYVQCVGRGTRPLAGVIDGLATPAERLAAIAGSAKPDLRILDFLWLSDDEKLSLVKPIDLVAGSPKIREQMLKDGGGADGDLVEMEERAERDLLKTLEKAAKEHVNKKARVIDPLKLAVSLGDADLAGWQPETKWDGLPATANQLDSLRKQGIDVDKVTCRGLASRLLGRVFDRQRLGLCTPKQLNFLERLGVQDAALVSFREASALIDAKIKEKEAARAKS